jgi:hypothetical protein
MDAELLRELISHRTSKQKSVMMASRSILQLYRILNPELLPRKERVSRFYYSLNIRLLFVFSYLKNVKTIKTIALFICF